MVLALRKVSVHAYEDPGRPEGGHAIVLLHGLDKVPANPAIRLKPADPGTSADAAGWPQGELRPLSCRPTPEGLEILIGPEVTESELLLPGTLVEIEMPDGGVRGEFLWPNIAPMLRPKKRTVIVNNPRRAKDAAASGAKIDAVPSPGEAPATATDATVTAPATPPSEPSATEAALRSLEDLAAGLEPKPDRQAPEPTPARPSSAAPLRGMPAAIVPSPRPAQEPSRTMSTDASPAVPPPSATPSADPSFYPHARAGRVSGAPKSGMLHNETGGRRASNAAQAIAGLLAVVAALYVLSRESSMRTVAPQPASDGASIVTPSTASSTTPVFSDRPLAGEQSLYETLSVGAISPRGTSAAATTATRALENANALLSGTNRDTEEAAFWLRRYITGTIGNDRTTRALTQLGSVYAEPVGGAAPDYVKARLLWELAGAAGDPVAMCFLGLLHENGLGSAPDKRTALQWYERSKLAGGCPQVDASIARVKQ